MTMTKAELRTTREAIGLTPRFIAERVGCHPNIIWRQESATHPAVVTDAVSDAVYALLEEFDEAVNAEALAAKKRKRIYRARTFEEFTTMHPLLAAWPERVIGPFYAEVGRRVNAHIIYTETPEAGQ